MAIMEDTCHLLNERKRVDPHTAEALDQFLLKLKACVAGDSSFIFILDDPAGHGFIENPFAPSPDPSLKIKSYERTPEQQDLLGYVVGPSHLREEATTGGMNNVSDQITREQYGTVGAPAGRRVIAQGNSKKISDALFRYSAPEEVITFPSTCGACAARCETRMFATNIPYFQEVIVMASSCDGCGYRNSELKPGGCIPAKGKKVTVRVTNIGDLSRDVIKSDTAGVSIPETDLELGSGILGEEASGSCFTWPMDSNLDHALIKGQWTDEEDRKLIRLVKKHGVRNWAQQIAQEVMCHPSDLVLLDNAEANGGGRVVRPYGSGLACTLSWRPKASGEYRTGRSIIVQDIIDVGHMLPSSDGRELVVVVASMLIATTGGASIR
ncbi:hypothetical protein RJ640_028545 [Escallonia rubra]|uniref:Zinc finger ZPR1-type domain-containing protein n=1 Tax=Escallonia rubra TaxID=112253 RepID=A0AA88RJR6_9ASTE|nr:hypothetical protein RJ640_028545 [Escallonia rubra]